MKKLREAGAIILAKVNMSEFASGGAYSSLGGQSLNPHDLDAHAVGIVGRHRRRDRRGVRADRHGHRHRRIDSRTRRRRTASSALKPTHGLLSRSGIIPLALSFDTGGPMARSVYDVAVALGVMTGVDPADAATTKSDGQVRRPTTRRT